MSRKFFCLIIRGLIFVILFCLACPVLSAAQTKGSDRVLSKMTFIHFKKGHAKPPQGGSGNKTQSGYYGYLSKGAKWKTAEALLLNPDCGENPDAGLDGLITDAVLAGMEEWETPGRANIVIFGDLYIDDTVAYEQGNYRGYNTISFGSYSNPDVIAVTAVWGYFTGPINQREIVEAHILMNDDFVWGDAAGNPVVMDLQNIFTHELGHWAGMNDLYETVAAQETMYGYSDEGEIKKRDLYTGDITGITGLYR